MIQRRTSLQWLTFAGLALFFSAATLLAVHDFDLFELGDGMGTPGSADILGSDTQPGCDWADLFDADPTPEEIATAVDACGGLEAAFVLDQIARGGQTDDTTFSSSKNDQPIASWRWESGKVPTKDDISNYYAYATLNEVNELILYAGVERLDPSGSSHVDFELNQSVVGLDVEPPCGSDGSDGGQDGPPCEFTGEKIQNDILVSMNFTQGGDLGELEIRQWNGTDYVIIDSLGGEGCNTDNTVCALNNGFDIDGGPWPNFDSKARVIETIEPNGFTEAAINVTQLLGTSPCFATLQAKTRTSASYNSSLKDFALADFSVCSVDVDKNAAGPTGEPLSKIGDLVTFSFSVTNDGGGTLRLQSMNDSLLGDITGEAQTAGCEVLSISDRCEFDIVQAIPEDSDDPINSTVSVVYISEIDVGTGQSATQSLAIPEPQQDGAIISSVDDTDSVEINLFQPAVTVDKTGDPLSTPGNTALYTITITNAGSSDSPDLANGVIVDTLLGDLLDPANPFVTSSTCGETLPAGGTCVIQAARVVQETDPDPLPNTVSVTYNPAGGFPNVISDFDDHSVDLVYPGCDIDISALPLTAQPGDIVTYGYTFSNTGDVIIDTISVEDTLLGPLTSSFPASLDPGETFSTEFTRTIGAEDPTPLTNTSTAVCGVRGLPDTTVTDSATVNIDVVRPSITVSKTGDLLSTAGNTVSYVITVVNTSSANTPDLVNGTLTDTLLGNLLDAANPFVVSSTCTATLAGGASCTVQAQRVVQETDPDPLPNTVSASYNPDGLPFNVTGSDSHTVDLVSPGLTLTLDVSPLDATLGTTVTWTYVVTNTGDVPVDQITVNDTVLGDISGSFPTALDPGQSVTVTLTRVIQPGDPDPLVSNSVATYQVRDLPNVITGTATASIDIIISCALSPGFWKGGEGVPKWDSPSDAVAVAAGFFTGTPFPYLDPSLAGSSYLDVLNTARAGDVTLQLAFKYIAARLNQATFGAPGSTGALLDQIDAYLAQNPVGSDPRGRAKNDGQDLLAALNGYFAAVGEGGCPAPSEF